MVFHWFYDFPLFTMFSIVRLVYWIKHLYANLNSFRTFQHIFIFQSIQDLSLFGFVSFVNLFIYWYSKISFSQNQRKHLIHSKCFYSSLHKFNSWSCLRIFEVLLAWSLTAFNKFQLLKNLPLLSPILFIIHS